MPISTLCTISNVNGIPLSTAGCAIGSEAGERSAADMLQGSLELPTAGSPDVEGGEGEGGGVCCLGGSGMKDLCCRAIRAPRRTSSSLSPVSR